MAQRQGIIGKPVRNPLTGEIYADGVVPQSRSRSFARAGAGGLPAPTRAGIVQQLRLAAAPPGLQRQVRRQGRSHSSARAMTAFVRFSHRKVEQLRAAADSRRDRQPGNGYVERAQPAGRRRRDLTRSAPTSLLEVRLGVVAHQGRQEPPSASASPNMLEAYGITGLPTDPRFAGGLTAAGGQRLDDVGPPEQQSAVPESVRHRPAHQLLVDRRPPHA